MPGVLFYELSWIYQSAARCKYKRSSSAPTADAPTQTIESGQQRTDFTTVLIFWLVMLAYMKLAIDDLALAIPPAVRDQICSLINFHYKDG